MVTDVILSSPQPSAADHQATPFTHAIGQTPTTIVVDRPGPLGDTTTVLDGVDRPIEVTDGLGQTTTYTYTDLDQVETVTEHGAGSPTITFVYDDVGNRTSRSDPTGTVTTGWDLLNRVDEETRVGTVISYVWDDNNNLTSVTDTNGTVSYTYNELDLLTSVSHWGKTIDYTPDNLHLRSGMIEFPNDWTVDYSHDDAGRVEAIEVADDTATQQLLRDYSFDSGTTGDPDDDRTVLAAVTDENGDIIRYGYDSLDRLVSAVTKDGGGATIEAWSFDHDANGNVVETGHDATTTWSEYNGADQLCWTAVAATRPVNACASTPVGGTGYSHDTAGNLTATSAGRSLGYNSFNQATSQTGPAGGPAQSHTYLGQYQNERRTTTGYDPTIYRRQSLVGVTFHAQSGNNRRFVRDPAGNVVAIHDVANNRWGYYLRDARESVIGIVDGAGTITNRYEYTPYGEDAETTAGTSFDNPYRYLGAEADETTGYLWLSYRDYDPKQGRFTQPDPSGQEANRYLYAIADPVSQSDPSGLCVAGLFGDCDNPVNDYLTGDFLPDVGFAAGCAVAGTFGAAGIGVGALSGNPVLVGGGGALSLYFVTDCVF